MPSRDRLRVLGSQHFSLEAYLYEHLIAPAIVPNILTYGLSELAELDVASTRHTEMLDVGCGGGQLGVFLAERFEHLSVTGVDLDANQIARARHRSRHIIDRVRFQVGDALALPFDDCTFDAVISVASLKHWSDRSAGIAECVRVLSPKGRLVIMEIDRGCSAADARRFVSSLHRIPAPLRRLFLLGFRAFVVRRSIDLDDARGLLALFDLHEVNVNRVPKMPILSITAYKSSEQPRGARDRGTRRRSARTLS